MNCINNFCIYCDNEKCILDSISLDVVGICLDFIQINMDEAALKIEKIKLLQKFQQNQY